MLEHSHLHRTVSISLDKSAVLAAFLFLWFVSYALGAFVAQLIDEYGNLTRCFIAVLAAVAVLLVYALFKHHMKGIKAWLEGLEERTARTPPDEVGIGTRIILWGFKATTPAPPLPAADIEHGSFTFSSSSSTSSTGGQARTALDAIPAAFTVALDSIDTHSKKKTKSSTVHACMDAATTIQMLQMQRPELYVQDGDT